MALRPRRQTFWSGWEAILKRHSLWLLEKLFGKEVQTPQIVTLEDINSVLVIRQHDQLGDFILATPVLRALREHLPHARIGLLVREYFEDVAFMMPFVDEVLVFCERFSRWTWRRIQRLRRGLRGRWDLCIVLNTVSHSLTSDLLAHLSGAPVVLGSAAHVFPGCSRNFFYDLIAPLDENVKHQTERNLDIVRYIGIDTLDRMESIIVPEVEKQRAKQYLVSRGVRFGTPVIGLHIGAGKPENRWPASRFAELASSLHRVHDADILLFWGPAEEELCNEFCARIDFPIMKISPTNLKSLAALFAQCDVLVCNDSAPMHIAAAASVPIVAMFGKTEPEHWKPIGEKFDYVRAKDEKIEKIPIDVVLHKIRDIVTNNKKTVNAFIA